MSVRLEVASRTVDPAVMMAPTIAIATAQIGNWLPGMPPPALTTVGTVAGSGVIGIAVGSSATTGSGVATGAFVSFASALTDVDGDASATGTTTATSPGPFAETAGVGVAMVVGEVDGDVDGEAVGVGDVVTTGMTCVGQEALVIQSAPAVALTPG
jgi:hypothetical protein